MHEADRRFAPSDEAGDASLPDERIEFSFSEAVMRSVWSGCVTTTIVVGFIMAMILAINILAFVGGNKPNLINRPLGVLFVSAIVWCVFACVGVPIAFVESWKWRPRRVRVDGDDIVVETRSKEIRLPLERWQWRISGRLAIDRSGAYLARNPLLMLSTRQSGMKGGQELLTFACGFSPEHLKNWDEFLRARGVLQLQPSSLVDRGFRMFLASSAGIIIGAGLGLFFASVLGIQNAVEGLGLLGLLDGAILGVGWNIVRNWDQNDAAAWTKTYAVLASVTFAALALKIGFVGGLHFAIGCSLANALLGYVAFRLFHAHVLAQPSGFEATDVRRTDERPHETSGN